MKGISLIIPSVKQKSGKKRSRRKTLQETAKQDENSVIDSEENLPRKKVKKIRIRLADPKIPDSYICEVSDSSFEQDEGAKKMEKEIIRKNSAKGLNLREKPKPKDYFDVLMSRECRGNFKLNNVQSKNELEVVKEIEGLHLLTNSTVIKKQPNTELDEMVNKTESFNECCSSTSEDESLFQVQSKIRLFATNSKLETSSSRTVCRVKNKKNIEGDLGHQDSAFSQPKEISLIKKNKSNILNYFSKTDTGKVTMNEHAKPMKFADIEIIENPKSNDVEKIPGAEDAKLIKKNEMVKLAPLFLKKTKNVIDPQAQKARLEFLQNGLPTIMKSICNNKKIMEEKYSNCIFPLISHVQQKDDDPLWTSTEFCLPSLKIAEANDDFYVKNKIFRFEMSENTNKELEEVVHKSFDFNNLRLKYSGLNVESIFNSFKEKRDNFLQKVETSILNRNSDPSDDSVEAIDFREGCNTLWTEIYKPKSGEIIANKNTVAKLSNWLKSWKEYSYNIIVSNAGNKVSDLTDDSDDDFVSSIDEQSKVRAPKNICLLSGPIASGKTTLVYALAAELDYIVLEVNASSKRTGKKLLLDLQEATKSHEVSSGFALFTENDRKQPKIKTIKSKKKKNKNIRDTNINSKNNSKISLILVEDADIYFEDHDEGFVSAISTLVQSTKRPFIFLSNDPNYGYLERLRMQEALMLEMRRPDYQNSCAVLDVIAVLEGVNVEKKALENLIQNNQYDLRKSILELQFWMQPGRNLKKDKYFELGKLWWGFNRFLYMKDNIHRFKLNYRKRKRTSDLYDSSSGEEEAPKKVKLKVGNVKTSKNQSSERTINPSIHAFSKILDSVSITDLFKLEGDPEPIPWNELRPKDGLSLSECMESVDWKAKNLSKSIANEYIAVSANIFANSCRDRCDSNYDFCNPPWEETLWRNMQQKARLDLISLVPSNVGCNKRILYLDYLPALRSICRTEKIRYQGNTKRKNRFCHYFRSLGFNPRDESLDISCDIFG